MSNSGLSFGSVLFVIFLVLKLVGVISWPWLWVTAPLWIPLGLFLVLAAIVGAAHIINEAKK